MIKKKESSHVFTSATYFNSTQGDGWENFLVFLSHKKNFIAWNKDVKLYEFHQ